MIEQRTAAGFVRPRFDDGTFDEPLPLEDHVLETVVRGERRAQLVIEGPRGSGLTTALETLRGAIARERPVHGPGPIAVSGDQARDELDRGEAVLLLDLSHDPRGREFGNKRELLKDAHRRDWRAVAVAHAPAPRPYAQLVQLAPWTWDDLIDLLGDPTYREQRGRILAALRALPDGAALIARARTARWLVDAAAALGPDEPVTLARLYANVLDTLAPSTLEVLRRLPAEGEVGVEAFLRAVSNVEDYQAEEAAALFELDRGLAVFMATPENRRALNVPINIQTMLHLGKARLALPGLHHMMQAGHCLERAAQDDPPEEVAPAWFPYLRELITEPLRERLRGWLADLDVQRSKDGQAATLLWACGETPALDSTRRPHVLHKAHLQRVVLPGVNLWTSRLVETRLEGARLEGARLEHVDVSGCALDDAVLDGADLTQARVTRSSLRGTSLCGARGQHLHVELCDLRGADLEGARLAGARLRFSILGGANLRRASLLEGELVKCGLEGACLDRVDLRKTRLELLDLTKALTFAPATLAGAHVVACELAGLELDDLNAEESMWRHCDLFEARLRGAQLREAHFNECKLHGVLFDGADLRGAVFDAVNFHAGSSRAGLLLGKPALEGNMTGYYVEGTTDDAWASPDSIRQASFRGADLRGANFYGTNLFRVDFRDARLDPGMHAVAREHGAILDD